MFDPDWDARVRAAAFDWLAGAVQLHGDVLPRTLLAQGFILDAKRVPLVGPQGIFKPRVLEEVPLSITTVPGGPYDDSFGPDGLLRYRYRGTDPDHPDNRGLRACMVRRLPLIYLHRIAPGRYVPAWPVFVVGDDPVGLAFTVAVDDLSHARLDRRASGETLHDEAETARRHYITATVRVRLHQKTFRERVLEAYRRQCAFCRLRHEQLLDAAHIVPDPDLLGEPVVRNGLALCTLHHAAFDRFFVGVRPDFTIEVRPDILAERNGPTLVHAIQRLHGTPIVLPVLQRDHPDRELLQIRYEQFRQAVSFSPW